ncbi:MAG: zinc ABC transporter substrate-binding protein [Candidatus Omnitrophica bacterium]|nr:zinc ABC transporter substrate-binding protein [Candidatus Omnitrophota bacterium]
MFQGSAVIRPGLRAAAFFLGVLLMPGAPLWAQGLAGQDALSSGTSLEARLSPVRVETTLFPLYDMARAVGGEQADVALLIPPGIEPHSFEPSPADIVRINDSDIFIYTGETMEPWVGKLLPGISNQNLQIIAASQGLAQQGGDPHVWLDPDNDCKIVDAIALAFIDRDPEHQAAYRERADKYKAALTVLDAAYRTGLKDCRSRTIVYGGHFAFAYLAARYGLDQVSPYGGFAPDAEPAPRAVAELVARMRTLGTHTVFYEELIDPKVARVIAEETGAAQVLLSAAHNISADEKAAGVTFLSIMEDNLKKLKAGLECR